ncbi:hypothetical protein [Xanthomonas theicola]|uniref:hypothetical protein n=1 Tax=Xanthomonas theicola TaxID=56464 RepID=UPI000FF88CF3|nr:hypothetical protein [Xanthomonas theicola]QNH24984.1 hypothetical protein G4Q83_09840 [Xanthomonas theicola]
MKKINQPERFLDEDGRALVRLQVSGSDSPAVTEATLWDNACARYALTGAVYLNSDGKGHEYAMVTVPGSGGHTPLARLLLGRPKGYRVRYNDGDRLNLLPENLRLHAPWADASTAKAALAALLDAVRSPGAAVATYA